MSTNIMSFSNVKENTANENKDPWGRDLQDSYLVKDLARSGLVPRDFPFEPIALPLNDDGQGRYKFNVTADYWKIKIDRKENKYIGPKGVTPPIVFFGNFHNAPITATVEGYKKALLFYITTGIPTICIDGCWMFGESVEAAVDGLKAKELHTDIVARLGGGQHIVLFDGDWASNEDVQHAMATYRMLLEELNVKATFKDMGEHEGNKQGYDDWFVRLYGIDRSAWPSKEAVLSELLTNVPKVPTEALVGVAQSYLIHNLSRFSNESLDLNDRGAGSLLVRLIGAENLKYLKDTDQWAHWTGSKWVIRESNYYMLVDCVSNYYIRRAGAAEAQAKRLEEQDKDKAAFWKKRAAEFRAFGQGPCSTTTGRGQILKDVAQRAVLWAYSNDFDSKPHLLGVANGVVDLNTGELRPAKQSDMLTRACSIAYPVKRPSGTVTVGEKTYSASQFLAEITGASRHADSCIEYDPEMLNYLQLRLGSALRGENAEQTLDIWHGIGSNGKSVLRDLICAALGNTVRGGYTTTQNAGLICASVANRNPEGANPFLVMLRGARLVFLSEAKESSVFNDALIKQITGDSAIAARGNYQAGGHIDITFNAFLLTNPLPNCTNLDTALLDRLAFLHFAIRWRRNENDPEEAALPDVDRWWVTEGKNQPELLEYILWWMVEGAVKWKKQGGLGKPPARVIEKLQEYKHDNDKLAEWMAEMGWVFDLNASTASTLVYQSYKSYIENGGGRPVSNKSFSKRLLSRFPSQLTAERPGGKSHIKGIRLAKV